MSVAFERRAREARKKSLGLARFAGFAFLIGTSTLLAAQRRDYPTRPAGDPAAIERGKALYGVNCQFCHGADTRGGDSGPSLLRSGIVLDDQHGELIAPVVRAGRTGMPKFSLSDDQI